ncbi:MAG: hypothetical protein M3443_20885 [Actinomycetota bacterium]|nr:hypothetical protein [Actinomycetota bacterium]
MTDDTDQQACVSGVSVTDCRDVDGTTVGLIDAIISIARIAAHRDHTPAPVREALADLRSDEDVATLMTGGARILSGVHVIPDNDTLIHHSLDGRERSEPSGGQPQRGPT